MSVLVQIVALIAILGTTLAVGISMATWVLERYIRSRFARCLAFAVGFGLMFGGIGGVCGAIILQFSEVSGLQHMGKLERAWHGALIGGLYLGLLVGVLGGILEAWNQKRRHWK